MSAASEPINPPTSPATRKSISSAELRAGHSPSVSPDGLQLGLSGLDRVRVGRTAPQDTAPETTTPATSGPSSGASLRSAALQLSLESRLRARLGAGGSMEYELTWKRWAMPSGPPICRLRAWGRPTSDNASGGWPTPNAGPQNDTDTKWQERREALAERYGNNGFGMTLGRAASLTGWPTPTTQDDNQDMEKRAIRGKQFGFGPALSLGTAARMAGWNTPRATDGTHGGPNQSGGALPHDAAIAGWGTPTSGSDGTTTKTPPSGENSRLGIQVHGATSTSSPAPTGKRAALNPELPRWLLGFPATWSAFAPTATPSRSRSRPSS